MGDPTAKRWTARRLTIAAGATAVGALVLAREVWLARESYAVDPWIAAEIVLFAIVAGGLLGNLAWLLSAPKQRITRVAAVAAGLSLAAWAGFLVWGEPHVPMPSGPDVDIVPDWPVPIAERANGPFGSVNGADRVLNLAAGPAIGWVNAVWPPHGGSYDDVGRSYVVAALACVLSSAFWLAVGNAWSARRARRRALRTRSPWSPRGARRMEPRPARLEPGPQAVRPCNPSPAPHRLIPLAISRIQHLAPRLLL